MSNVYTTTNYAVLSIMDTYLDGGNTYSGSTVYVQQKPEDAHGNLTTLSYANGTNNFEQLDFNVQARFEANVVPVITTQLSEMKTVNIVISNSNISVQSYRSDGKQNA